MSHTVLKRFLVGACITALPMVAVAETCNNGTTSISHLTGTFEAPLEEIETDQLLSLSLELTNCLGHPNPVVRDDLAYGTLTKILRSDRLSDDETRSLRDKLFKQLNVGSDDGFESPFVALVLSEVARTDRVSTYLSDEEFEDLVQSAADYLSNVTDYRGFIDREGWRHGVAHGADWAMQLVLNERISAAQINTLLSAVKMQVQAANGHAYIHNEPSRLARPVLFGAMRSPDALDWKDWLTAVSDPTPLESWNDAFQSEADLARLHNTKAFVQTIYLNASLSSNEAVQALEAPSVEILRTLP